MTERPNLALAPGAMILLLILFAFARGDLLIFAAIVLSVVAHEVGHLIPALCFGVKVKEIGANFIGFYIRRARATGIREKVICLGGPAVTLLCALFTAGLVSRFNWFLFMAVMLPLPKTDLMNAIRS